MSVNHLPFWLAALYLPGVGPQKIKKWLTCFDNIASVFSATPTELVDAGIAEKDIQSIRNPAWHAVESDLLWAEGSEHHLITLDDPRYPILLREIHDPPIVLYVRGAPTALACRQIAIVGSRHASAMGLRHAHVFAEALVSVGYGVTSGLALGIDGAAHRGALQGRGVTIAVIGTGLKQTYPSAHRVLADEIVKAGGAIVSEFPLTMTPQAANFPRRNRVIAGLSLGVLVVEAVVKSGSLISARHALEQGREVFAIPGSINNPLARGCHHLIKQGAKLVETAEDIIEELGAISAVQQSQQGGANIHRHDLNGEECKILTEVGYELTSRDEIILRSGLTAAEVSSILLALELQGLIQSVAGGFVRAV